MAIIGKIRNHTWLILVLLALALAAFLLMDVSTGRWGGNASALTMGKVAGEKIEYPEFQRAEQALYSRSNDSYASRASLWNFMVENAIIDKQSEELGLAVTEDEMQELQFGANLSPVIQNNFKDQQTNQVNRKLLQQYKQLLDEDKDVDPGIKAFWEEQGKQVRKTELQKKYFSMISKGMYTPKWQAEVINNFNNEKVAFNYVKAPFDNISDNDVTVSDEDVKSYISKHAKEYTEEEETRVIDYVMINVIPTKEDSTYWLNEISNTVNSFKTDTKDSLFAVNNGGAYINYYSKADELGETLKNAVADMEVGQVYGPYYESNAYVAAKLIDTRVVADTAQARHILKRVDFNNPQSLESAKLFIDSLKTLFVNGTESFDSLAIKNSDDKGSGFKGGDLGKFTQGAMVPEFNNAVFLDGKKGGLYVVTSQFGIHLIEVTDLIYNNQDSKYKLAYIRTPIIPTQETQNAAEDAAGQIIAANSGLAGLEEAAKNIPNATFASSKALKINDYFISAEMSSGETTRSMIKWAFDSHTNVGNVSPEIYSYLDKVNYFDKAYVVIGLKSITPPGLQTPETVGDNVRILVRNEKKGEKLQSQMTSQDLDALASQFNTTVATASNVNFNSGYIPDVGSEPKLVADVFKKDVGSTTNPIIGTTGVYVAKVTSKTPDSTTANLADIQKNTNNSYRGSINYKMMNALKEIYKPEDFRNKFF